ncbi:hypothetical protein [Methylomagnum sp.]
MVYLNAAQLLSGGDNTVQIQGVQSGRLAVETAAAFDAFLQRLNCANRKQRVAAVDVSTKTIKQFAGDA